MGSRNVGDFDVFPILLLIITAHSRQAVSRKYDFNLVVVILLYISLTLSLDPHKNELWEFTYVVSLLQTSTEKWNSSFPVGYFPYLYELWEPNAIP